MKIYREGFTYGPAPLGPHASCVHEVSRYGVHARRVRSQAHTANGSASYFHRRHEGHEGFLAREKGLPDLVHEVESDYSIQIFTRSFPSRISRIFVGPRRLRLSQKSSTLNPFFLSSSFLD